MPPGIDRRDALALGVQVLWRMCDEHSPMVRLRDRHAIDRLLASSASSVSWKLYLISELASSLDY